MPGPEKSPTEQYWHKDLALSPYEHMKSEWCNWSVKDFYYMHLPTFLQRKFKTQPISILLHISKCSSVPSSTLDLHADTASTTVEKFLHSNLTSVKRIAHKWSEISPVTKRLYYESKCGLLFTAEEDQGVGSYCLIYNCLPRPHRINLDRGQIY